MDAVLGRSRGMSETLTMALPQGDTSRAAFDALYRSAAGDVYAYVRSIVRDTGAAEDVTAAAFEKAFRRRRSFDARRGSERAWLFGIARNAALDELRRRRRTIALTLGPAGAEAGGGNAADDPRGAGVRAARAALHAAEPAAVALQL